MFKFIHAADIHLDSPLLGLERYEGAPAEEIRGATRRAFENLVELALAEAVNFVLIAGDLYDGDWKDARTGLYFVRQMARLREAGIPVYLVTGNHDAQNRITRELRFPENVKWFSARKPETAMIESLNVAIHGQSYAAADTRENLAEDYPRPAPGAFNIGLLHTCASGLPGHEPYAPCPLPVMTGKGYQYWALGHVHTAQALSEDPPVVFPGNIQGRHIRETGPRGCLLASVDERQRITRAFVPVDVFRWYVCEIDATGAASEDEVIGRFDSRLRELLAENAGYPLALRVVLSGTTEVHRKLSARRAALRERLQEAGLDLGQGAVWIERLVIGTQAEGGAAAPEGPIRELKEYLDELRAGGGDFEAVWEELNGLREFMPADLRTEYGPEQRRELLNDVEALLMDRLLGGEAVR